MQAAPIRRVDAKVKIAGALAILSSAASAGGALLLLATGATHPFRLGLALFAGLKCVAMLTAARALLRASRRAAMVIVSLCIAELALFAPGIVALRPIAIASSAIAVVVLLGALLARRTLTS